MKDPTFSPAYVGLYPILAEVACDHCYALAVHGTLQRDFDLVAVPWVNEATDRESLIRAIAARIGFTMDSAISVDRLFEEPYTSSQPHGRRSWALPLDCGAYLDISVLPRVRNEGESA